MNRPVMFLHGGNVGGWIWEPQVAALSDRLTLAPDLPGYRSRRKDPWISFDAVADRLVDVIDEEVGQSVDLVGLSLGGITALHLASRYPDRVASVFVTGASVLPYTWAMRAANRVALAVWNRRFYWVGTARQFGLRGADAEDFLAVTPPVTRENIRQQLAEVYPGGLIASERITAPMMAVAGEKETAYFHDSLRVIRAGAPRAMTGLAPGMHHAWNGEDPELFNRILRTWLEERAAHPDLLPLPRDAAGQRRRATAASGRRSSRRSV